MTGEVVILMVDDSRRKQDAREWMAAFGGTYREALAATSWPRDMVIRLLTPSHLNMLLFIRSAWDLRTREAPYELDSAPERGSSVRPEGRSPQQWAELWDTAWLEGHAWQQDERPRAASATLDPGAVPPFWTSVHSDEGIDLDAFAAWESSVQREPGMTLAETPERRSTAALTKAWNAGLRQVVQLPLLDMPASTLRADTLMIGRTERADPRRYRAALDDYATSLEK